ncbi:MAG: hypothetical protein RL088_2663 [Verrucomicrobiota bacterium]|jgi:RNA polymerase sigma-70 factor (ECF subfamily)
MPDDKHSPNSSLGGADADAGLHAGAALFPRTRWSLVRRASGGAGPLGDWIGFYWYPLYAWSRGRGASPEDAADGVQGFLEKLCARNLLAQADETRGKLRSWLLASFSNYLATEHTKSTRLKRGGIAERVRIDWGNVESAFATDLAADTQPDRVYARAWAITLLDEALERVGKHYEKTARQDLFAALLPALESPLAEDT